MAEKQSIPSRRECLALMAEQGMWRNIVRHSLLVERVARSVAEALLAAGEMLNVAEVSAGALLHDITKTRSIQTRENHARSGQELLKELGYARIGTIVGCHVFLPDMLVSNETVSAEEVVHYADKRVLHDKVVSLSERFEDLINRYGVTPHARARLEHLKEQSYYLEEKIFSRIDFIPDDFAILTIEE
jgi:putative nucleotidyltransferase with HDIG domain